LAKAVLPARLIEARHSALTIANNVEGSDVNLPGRTVEGAIFWFEEISASCSESAGSWRLRRWVPYHLPTSSPSSSVRRIGFSGDRVSGSQSAHRLPKTSNRTRLLAGFAKMVEVFDENGVSFV
jgi:hypothetical protein